MTFEQLYYFEVTANLLNFTKAADLLYISQPTLSRQISQLESELDTQLLIRDNRQVYLTEAGKILLEETKVLLERHAVLRQRIHQVNAGLSGELNIVSMSIYYPTLYRLFHEYRERFSDVTFRLQFHDMGLFSEALMSGKADVAIGYSMELPESMGQFGVIPLFKEHFVAVMSEFHEYAHLDSITMADLKSQHMLFLSQNKYEFVKQLWRKANFESFLSSGLHITDSLNSIILEIRSNPHAVTLIPKSAALEHSRGCAIVEVSDLDSEFETVMMYKQENQSRPLQNFINMTKAFFEEALPPL